MLQSGELLAQLESIAPGSIRTNVRLSEITQWRIGGAAKVVVEPSTTDQVAELIAFLVRHTEPYVVIGSTSNILFSSDGFDGVLIKIGTRMSRIHFDGSSLRVQAGAAVPDVVDAAAARGLGGIIHAAGIPGTIGGLVLMNGGTRRLGIGDHVRSVVIADADGKVRTLERDELSFSYRTSSLQQESLALLEVVLDLEPGNSAELVQEITSIREERARKFPLTLPNCGSTFLSDPAMYKIVGAPGHAIETAGLKGVSRGGAQISPVHANFIVNTGGAVDTDVLWLIGMVRDTVVRQTGFMMNCEVRYLSPRGEMRPAHEAADRVWAQFGEKGQ